MVGKIEEVEIDMAKELRKLTIEGEGKKRKNNTDISFLRWEE